VFWSADFSAVAQSWKSEAKPRQEIAMDDRAKLVALQRHWDASDAGNFEAEHEN
jgi:hypothetical protein